MDELKKLLIFCFLSGLSQVSTSCTCDGTTLTVNGEQTCFEVVNGSGGSWAAADKKCSSLGGFLAHIQEKNLLTNLTSLISQSSTPLMVGQLVGNVEYEMIAYMCPHNSYKSLVTKSTIEDTIVGDASTNDSCLFIQSSDHKLHYGSCTQTANVLCQIPMETTDYCGIMCGGVTASSTTSNGVTVAASTMPNECGCNGVTTEVDGDKTCFEIADHSGGNWRNADQKCADKNGFVAHIMDERMLTTLKNYVKSNYKRPIMVGHIVGNAEYSLIAYMCPNNSYKDLMDNSVIDQTINGNSTDNATCLFIENSDYKLHYGTCTMTADVLCEIPLESDSRCGVMRSCSSTSSISSKTTVSTKSASSSKTSSNPLSLNNANSNSSGLTKTTSKSNSSNSSSNKQNSTSTNSNGTSPTVSTNANGSSTNNNNSSSTNNNSLSSSSQGNSNPTNSSSTLTNSNSNSSNSSNAAGSSPNSNSNNSASNNNSNGNGGVNNGRGNSSNPLILADYDQDNGEGTFDKEETIPPTGKPGGNSKNPFGSNAISQDPLNSTATTTFNTNSFHNASSSQVTGLSTLRTRGTTRSVSNASPTAEDILNMANDYNYPYGNDSMMDPLYNDTFLLYFDPNGNDGRGECYGRAYSRVGRWCVAWWVWLLIVLLAVAVLILFFGILFFFCGFSGLRRDHTNIVYIDQPPRTVFIDKPRPTVTTVVEQLEIVQIGRGPPTILYDIAVSETIAPGYIVPPKPYYPTSPMMLLGPDDPYTNRSMSLGMIEEIRTDSPSNQITHENLAGSKLDLPGHSSPYDDRLPTGATSVIPPPIVQPESGNVPSMSDGLRDIDYNHPATNVPLKTFDEARRSAPAME
ncbi:unnamed protein product [Bursaphelenchus xylophilus]|uniref:(pine wood nematode) hypothetical protein n=1 Tax=Bursaphelenchus xylophilus TaxID=6326 RepID=A0A1I7RZB5_BURXY|nr:unnamed protein product [Bursaphelenchus xylophilus]CAG9106647.1 unnamed protein product [Bursaphelenchus xylophilus]